MTTKVDKHNIDIKIPPLLLVALFGFMMWVISYVTESVGIKGIIRYILILLSALCGVLFNFFGVLSFKKAKTTVNPLEPHKSTSLVKSGIYRYTRNPMYVGFLFWIISWALFLNNIYSFVVALLFIPYMNHFQIKPEEKILGTLFGESYQTYKRQVRRWL